MHQLDRSDPAGAIAAAAKRCSNWGRWGADDERGTSGHPAAPPVTST